MLDSEKFAIAARLHVALRRANGRVTDVEWLLKSPEYAREIIKVARGEPNPDLNGLADKLEAAMLLAMSAPRSSADAARSAKFVKAASGNASGFGASDFANTDTSASADTSSAAIDQKRYVRTLR